MHNTILFHCTCKSQQLDILSIPSPLTNYYIAVHIAIPDSFSINIQEPAARQTIIATESIPANRIQREPAARLYVVATEFIPMNRTKQEPAARLYVVATEFIPWEKIEQKHREPAARTI